jgi:hypothetical protein
MNGPFFHRTLADDKGSHRDQPERRSIRLTGPYRLLRLASVLVRTKDSHVDVSLVIQDGSDQNHCLPGS